MSFLEYNITIYEILFITFGREPTKHKLLEFEDVPKLRSHHQIADNNDGVPGVYDRAMLFSWLNSIEEQLAPFGVHVDDTEPEAFVQSTAQRIMIEHDEYIFSTIQTIEHFERTGKILLYHVLETAAARTAVMSVLQGITDWDGTDEDTIRVDVVAIES
jgi:hypothetical protein